MSSIYKTIDISDGKYNITTGEYFNSFSAGEELRLLINMYFPSDIEFEEISRRQGQKERSESLFKCRFTFAKSSNHIFYIYVCPIEGGGRPNAYDDEARIQFNSPTSWTPTLDTLKISNTFDTSDDLTNQECYVLGIFRPNQQSHNDIICGFNPSLISDFEINGTSTKSIQTKINSIQEAYIKGVSLYKKSDNSTVISFKPKLLYWYMRNRDALHLGDLKLIEDNQSKRPRIPSIKETELREKYADVISPLRTKPFLLLAGISGTGKSQKVQELAFMTCPERELREENNTTPGNYRLIEVKPNWHDSSELLGYYSALSGKYELTDFIRFSYKAIQNPDTPFFLCLDEMNLAPVEQYFAEYLSVLETRKKIGDNIETQPLLTKDKFSNCELQKYASTDDGGVITKDGEGYNMIELYSESDREIIEYLKENGLNLPSNLFVIGTVNMDDTTHQFSRKVIDRAFTIEMNGGKMEDMFSEESRALLEYRKEPIPLDVFKSEFVRASEILDDERFKKYADTIKKEIPQLLGDSDGKANEDCINGILNKTPFRVSYRVQNELVLYLSVLIENANFPEDITPLIHEATLAILLEKVLPRVQGEQKQLETKNDSNVLKDMKMFVENHFKPIPEEGNESSTDCLYSKVLRKLEEMDKKLENYYTNFF